MSSWLEEAAKEGHEPDLQPQEIVTKTYKRGEPCKHAGCLHHVSHPCEGCGRIAGK